MRLFCGTMHWNNWCIIQPSQITVRCCSNRQNGITIGEVHRKWTRIFRNQQIGEPTQSSANILAKILNTRNLAAVFQQRNKFLSELQLLEVEKMCSKRLQRMPVQYIIGEWDFREITLFMRPPVFIPRPETEMLVELALQDIRRRQIGRVLELCCGSGAIALSLLKSAANHLEVVAIDKSKEACQLCEDNAKHLNLDGRIKVINMPIEAFHTAFDPKTEKFDAIISNPPYILSRDMRSLQAEIVQYEDCAALDGGEDGLDVIRQIFALAAQFLNPRGRLFLEVDPTHPARLSTAEDYGPELSNIAQHEDLRGVMRFMEFMKR